MKKIFLTSPETHLKVLVVSGYFCAFALTAVVGLFLPVPQQGGFAFEVPFGHLLNSAICCGLAVFSWSLFCLFEPARPGIKWIIAKWVCAPVLWVTLVTIIMVWLNHVCLSDSLFPEQILHP